MLKQKITFQREIIFKGGLKFHPINSEIVTASDNNTTMIFRWFGFEKWSINFPELLGLGFANGCTKDEIL